MLVLILAALAAPPAETVGSISTTTWGSVELRVATDGGRTPAAALTVLSPVGGALGTCLPDRTTVQRVEATLTVAADGRVTGVTTMASPGASAVEACVDRALAASAWPAAAADARVTVTVVPMDLLGGIGGLVGRKGTQLGGPGAAKDAGVAAQGGNAAPSAPVELAPGVRVDLAGGLVLGALDKARIDAVVLAAGPALGACWAEAHGRAPALRGRVVEKLVIDATGKVSSASVKSTTVNDAALDACVSRAAGAWAFPAPTNGGIVIASYPIDFTPP